MTESTTFWPWWAGALALAGVALGYWRFNRVPLGVSGHWERFMNRRHERALDAAAAAGQCDGMRTTWGSSAAFLAGIFLGGLLSRLWAAGWSLRMDMGETAVRLFGRGWAAWAVLFAGGVLVGYGTRLADGCTSGHGLVGCSRLQPGSLVSTALFFGTAVLVSQALARLLG